MPKQAYTTAKQVTIDIPDDMAREIESGGGNLADYVRNAVTGQYRRPSTAEDKAEAVRGIMASAEKIAARPGSPLPSIRSMIEEGRRY